MGIQRERLTNSALGKLSAGSILYTTLFEPLGMCRDNGVTVMVASGTDLTGSVMGGVNGMLAEMDSDSTVARLAAGKKQWRGQRRVDGPWPYGQPFA